MKAKVIRNLQSGLYSVAFIFSDFTQEELAKMKSFGVPLVQIKTGIPGQQQAINMSINQVTPNHVAFFFNEQEAKNYEAGVLSQVKSGMEAIRLRKDDFSSTVEVEI